MTTREQIETVHKICETTTCDNCILRGEMCQKMHQEEEILNSYNGNN